MKFDYSKLFKKMMDMGMNKGDLTKAAGISTNQMAKMGKGESVQLETAAKVCNVLGCKFDDIQVFQ